jgi:hypothetical protein
MLLWGYGETRIFTREVSQVGVVAALGEGGAIKLLYGEVKIPTPTTCSSPI